MKGENNIRVPLEIYEINLLLRWMKNCEHGMEIYRHISKPCGRRLQESCDRDYRARTEPGFLFIPG